MTLTQQAHELIGASILNQEIEINLAVDMTCGNGFDTEFLCAAGFTNVIGFDIQLHALESTQQRLKSADLTQATLYHTSHENIDQLVTSPIDCAMFNFGYLPNGDKAMTTLTHSSQTALNKTLKLLSTKSIITAICYPGHSAGKSETEAIEALLSTLSCAEFSVQHFAAQSTSDKAPRMYSIRRKPLNGRTVG